MKTLYKSIIIVVALALASTMVFGITAIASDDTAYKHAVWTTEKCRDSITYQGVEYKLLDGDVMPLNCRDYEVEDGLMYITEPDKTSTKDSFCAAMSFDGNFITTDIDNNEITYRELMTATAADGTMEVYCKADIYDSITAEINAGIEYTDYGYVHPVVNEEQKTVENNFYYFSDEENDAIKKILSEVTPVETKEYPNELNWIVNIDELSDNHFFTSNSYDIYQDNNGTYFLVKDSEKSYIKYEVPENMNVIFDQIVEDHLANTSIYEGKR